MAEQKQDDNQQPDDSISVGEAIDQFLDSVINKHAPIRIKGLSLSIGGFNIEIKAKPPESSQP